VSVQPNPPPTVDHERIQLLDQLRGLALLGILLVNMIYMAQPVVAVLRDAVPVSELDRAARGFIHLVAEAKFISMFSLLFGLGLHILGQRFESRGLPFKRVAARRYLALLLIGIAHGTLLWCGDILTAYAVLAFLLLAFRRRQPKTLLIWIAALGGLMIGKEIVGAILAALSGGAAAGGDAKLATRIAEATAAYTSSSYLEVTAQRASDYVHLLAAAAHASPLIFSMFLWGLYLGKKGWLADPEAHARPLRRLFIAGLAAGAPAALFHTLRGLETRGPGASPLDDIDDLATLVAGVGLALAYASGIALLSRAARWRSRLAFLAPVGRMALSNYVAQSLVGSLIFYGYGLGLLGQVSYAGGLLFTFCVFGLQILVSRWWFRHFRFGPLEWLWRAATYLTWPPMRMR
jgi:uncharacterized protein